MRKNTGAAVGALLVCAFTVATTGLGFAQASKCNVIIGGSGLNDGRTVFPQGGSFRVIGGAGCATPNGTVRIDTDSDRFTFANATFRARADGSYRSLLLALPVHLALGAHRIITFAQGGGEYVSPILIFESEVNVAAPAEDTSGVGDGLKITTTTTKSGGASLVWALALLAAATALVLEARKRGRRLHAIRSPGIRLGRRRPATPLALPAPDIPHIDTRGFVPMRPETAPLRARSMTEARPAAITEADLLGIS